MVPTEEFTVMLIMRHPNADPELLTRELGLSPEYSWRAGDSRKPESGGEASGKYRETYWAARIYPYPQPCPVPAFETLLDAFGMPVETASMPLESVLSIGTLILKRRRDLWERLQAEGASAEFLIALASCDRVDLKLPADLLSAMGSLGLSMSFLVESQIRAAA